MRAKGALYTLKGDSVMSGNDDRAAHDYSDIIDLPHHTSSRHPRMAEEMRAAQFAPFAALTGYEETIEETALRQQAEVMARDRMKE